MNTSYSRLFVAVTVSAALCCGCRGLSPADTHTAKVIYPPARKDLTTDVYHGIEVSDPYRWLEDTDDRVVPAHAKKFVATLQAEAAGKSPILLRVETKAGHGRGKPTAKIIDELADIYAFLFKTLDMPASSIEKMQSKN